MNLKSVFNTQFWVTKPVRTRILGNPPTTEKWWGRRLQHVIFKLLRSVIRLEDTPYRIAMGCACGIFSSALPIFGQTFIGMICARLLRANVIASLPWSWISNPFTTLPMWYGGYRLGVWLLEEVKALSYAQIGQLVQQFDKMHWTQGLSLMSAALWDALQPLWLGTVVMGMAMAAPGFLAVYYIVVRVQRRRVLQRDTGGPLCVMATPNKPPSQ
jgi:uncharacterized protein (DUF2062 family)